ncbi:MAG: hypothetical protein HY765_10885 [Rhodomicrobium sp.]|nr:hypothetical protein [Rhodomicrobium sp.]
MFRKAIAALAVLLLFTAGAQSAVLKVQGSAVIDRGSGFVPAVDNMEVLPGERIRVVYGTANIVYENGYTVPVQQNQVAAVMSSNPGAPGFAGNNPDTQTGLFVGGLALFAAAGMAVATSGNNNGLVANDLAVSP